MSDLQEKIRMALNGETRKTFSSIDQEGAREELISALLANEGWYNACKEVFGMSYHDAKKLRKQEPQWEEVIIDGAEEGLSRLAVDGDYRAIKDKLISLNPKKWGQAQVSAVPVNVLIATDLDALHQIWQARQEVLSIDSWEEPNVESDD